MTRPHVTWPRNHGSISGRIFFSLLQNRLPLAPTQSPIQWVPWGLPSSYSGHCVKLTTHLHLVPGLRMSGAIPLLHPYACKAQAGTILPFLLFTSLYIYNLFACNHFVISYSKVEPWQNDISEITSLIYLFFGHKLAAHMQDHRPTDMWWDKLFLKSFTGQWKECMYTEWLVLQFNILFSNMLQLSAFLLTKIPILLQG
jgi:hypothetical protein